MSAIEYSNLLTGHFGARRQRLLVLGKTMAGAMGTLLANPLAHAGTQSNLGLIGMERLLHSK